jgi:hypothetical protein
MSKVLFISLEGMYKKGVEKDLNEVLTTIKNDYDSNIDDWWENAYLDEEMDLISDNGSYDENLNFFIEHDGKFHDINEFLSAKL